MLHTLRSEGWKIIIHTTRSASEISEYLAVHNIPHDEINQNSSYPNAGPKPVATIHWHDRAVRYSGAPSRIWTELLVDAAPLTSGPKSLTGSISVGNIPGDPSDKSRAQDDSVLKVGNSIYVYDTKNSTASVPI